MRYASTDIDGVVSRTQQEARASRAELMSEAAKALLRCVTYGPDGKPLAQMTEHTASKLIEYHRPAGSLAFMEAEYVTRQWWWATLHTACLLMTPREGGAPTKLHAGQLPAVYVERGVRAFFVYGAENDTMTLRQATDALKRCGEELGPIREALAKLKALAVYEEQGRAL
jgi:hypothetical protein